MNEETPERKIVIVDSRASNDPSKGRVAYVFPESAMRRAQLIYNLLAKGFMRFHRVSHHHYTLAFFEGQVARGDEVSLDLLPW